MGTRVQAEGAQVTYRGMTAEGREVEIRRFGGVAEASAADAWARLTRTYGWVDPASLEIEIRERPAPAFLRLVQTQTGDGYAQHH